MARLIVISSRLQHIVKKTTPKQSPNPPKQLNQLHLSFVAVGAIEYLARDKISEPLSSGDLVH